MCNTALEVLRAGRSKAALAAALDVSKDTIFQWEKDYPEFSDSIMRGMAAAEAIWDDPGFHPEMNPMRWRLQMMNRFKWTDKQETTLAGEGFVLVQNLSGKPQE
jgi:tRNA U34 5-methylaminomethyl-2-thiouridine-forming methyltransferase MnmC